MLAIVDKPKFPPVHTAREQRDRARAARNRAISLIPRDDAPLTPANLKMLREADRQAAIIMAMRLRSQSGRRITPDEHGAARTAATNIRRLIMAVQRDVEERTTARYGARVNAETRALEEARGEIVARELVQIAAWRRHEGKLVLVKGLPVLDWEEATPLRVKTRDGLEALHDVTPEQIKALGITPLSGAQYDAGRRYRELYEKADPERCLRPAQNLDPALRGGGGPHHGGETWEDTRLEFARAVARVEALVREGAAIDRSNGDIWVRALREVAGKGRSINQCVTGGRARSAWRNGLGHALNLYADYLGLQ